MLKSIILTYIFSFFLDNSHQGCGSGCDVVQGGINQR
jgi:hypothetical protein